MRLLFAKGYRHAEQLAAANHIYTGSHKHSSIADTTERGGVFIVAADSRGTVLVQ